MGTFEGHTATDGEVWLLYTEPVTGSDAIQMNFRARRIAPLPVAEPETIAVVSMSREYNAEVNDPEIEASQTRFTAGPDGRLWVFAEQRLFVRTTDGVWSELVAPDGLVWDWGNDILFGFNGSGQTMLFYTRGDYNTSGDWAQTTTVYTLDSAGGWNSEQISRLETVTADGDELWGISKRKEGEILQIAVEHQDGAGGWESFDMRAECAVDAVEPGMVNTFERRPRVFSDGTVTVGFSSTGPSRTDFRAFYRDAQWVCEQGTWHAPSWGEARFSPSSVVGDLDGSNWTLTDEITGTELVSVGGIELGDTDSYQLARTASAWVLYRASLGNNQLCDLDVSIVWDDGRVENYHEDCSGSQTQSETDDLSDVVGGDDVLEDAEPSEPMEDLEGTGDLPP